MADYWDYAVSGSVTRDGDVQDLDSDLGIEARKHSVYSLAWNTGPGWWRPDFAASYTPIDAGGQQEVRNTGIFGSLLFVQGSSVARGDADLEDTDLSLRYPATIGSSTFWGGVTVKRIAGVISVRDQSETAEDRQRFDLTFPLLHVAASVPVQSWLSLSAQGNAAKYRDDTAYELRLGASIGVLGPVGINLGWQLKRYQINDGDYLLDAKLSGLLAGVVVTLR